ncbi:MAG: PEGA domain-containing protein, partial [Caldisericaceae bacterium]
TAEADKTIQLYAELHPSSASISITSVPDGADVYINSQKSGITPFNLDNVNPGTYNILVAKDGYAPYTESVTIAKGDQIERNLILQKANTFIMVTSTPAGCNVYLNDTLKGTTPYSEANLPPGTYSLRLEADGYLPFSTSIQIEQGKSREYDFTLVKLP